MQATTIPTRPTSTASLLGCPPGELVLKICGGEHDGRVLRLTAAKCTIGSAAGCTLRLRARGIRPVHALILRGPAGAAIRCWSTDAQLNERGFTEALLEIGDKLQFGPISLSVVDLASGSSAPRAALPAAIVNEVPLERPTRRPNRQRRKQLFGFLRKERQQQSNLQATVNNQREQLAAFEKQIDNLKTEMKVAPATPAAQPVSDDVLTQQFTRTIGQLRQELEAAAKRRTLEQQSIARQKAAWEEQSEQRVKGELEKLRTELQTQHQQASAASLSVANYERQIEGLEQHQLTLSREVESLKLALETRSKSEEMTRQNTAAQLEQLSQTFALVSQERDELFEQLHSEQALEQHQLTLTREIESLKLALETKSQSEEMMRQNTATQLEQLSQTFALVSQERDELFEQLYLEQSSRDESAHLSQAQVEEVRREAEAKLAAAQTEAQLQIARLREELAQRDLQLDEELIARTTNEDQRRTADAERIKKLTAELDTLRAESRSSSTTAQQQQEAFTQARKRWEEEVSTLNARLQESEKAVHTARTSSGELQASVLAEAEQARSQRDSVREQMLRQQQEWTEFRRRLESAAADERELARCCYTELEEELAKRTKEYTQTQAECLAAQERVHKLEIELELAQESLFVVEHGANQRLQQMTVSMESLQLDRCSAESQIAQERSEWERERNSLATCVTELQHEIAKLTEKVRAFEQQAQHEASESQSQQSTAEVQLQSAQEQLAQWQTAAERAQLQVNELSQEVAKFQQQEQEWQAERDQLDQQQQDSTGRLQQLETSIADMQRQLDDAQRAVAVTCAPPGIIASSMASHEPAFGSTINVNNQELAALCEQATNSPAHQPQNEFGGTININNQELAALCEQQNEATPSLLAPRSVAVSDPNQLAAFQAREAELEMRAAELAEQQQQLEEEQSTVARQRIELESFQASLAELEKSLRERAEALLQPAVPALSHDNFTHPDDYDQLYGGELERESHPLSESEAFAAMADQVAALHQPENDTPAAMIHSPHDGADVNYDAPAAVCEYESSAIAEATPEPSESVDSAASAIIEPVSEEEFDRQLEARVARVMRRESNDWQTRPATDSSNEEAPNDATASEEAAQPDQAVNSVLDRLREAGLWKGEGTAKVDQLPSSNPPLEEGMPVLCRLNESGPIGADAPTEDQLEAEAAALAEPEKDELSLIAANSTRTSLLETPAKEDDADDSIESYMSRLMQRLKTTTPEDEPAPQRKTQQARVSQPAPAQPAPPKLTDSRPLTSLEELAPRSQAPEQVANLAAMRELANSAARGAIAVHQKRNSRQKVNLRSINTLMALLVSAGLLFFWTKTGSWTAIGGVGLSLAWAIGSCLVAVMQSLTLRKAGAKEEASATEAETAE